MRAGSYDHVLLVLRHLHRGRKARELGDWLRGVGAGTEQSFRGYGEPQGYLGFTEPNLGFKLEERTAGRVRITAEFTGEATPPWFRRGPERAPNSYFVRLDLSAGGIAQQPSPGCMNWRSFPSASGNRDDLKAAKRARPVPDSAAPRGQPR